MTEPRDLVQEARELLADVSLLPWTADEMPPLSGGHHEWFEITSSSGEMVAEITNDFGSRFRNDAKLIARAPVLLHQLADEVEALRQENAELKTCDACRHAAMRRVCVLHGLNL